MGGKGAALSPRSGGLGHEQKPCDSHRIGAWRAATTCQGAEVLPTSAHVGIALWCRQGKGFEQANSGETMEAIWREDVPLSSSLP